MKLEGSFPVNAPREQVYAFLTDPNRVSRFMPDVQEVTIDDADHFTVKAKVGISHIKGSMVMKLAITDRNPPVGTTVTGKGSGLASVVDMVTSFALATITGDIYASLWYPVIFTVIPILVSLFFLKETRGKRLEDV